MPDNPIRKILTTQFKEVQGKDRVLEFTASTDNPDRDDEIIKAEAWQLGNYLKNPVVLFAHDYQSLPVGKAVSIKKPLTIEVEFAPAETYDFADTVYKLCKGGFLSAVSVGFIPLEWDLGKKQGEPKRTFTKVELLEISIVPVPSNPDALITARDAGVISVKEFDAITKPEVTEDYIRIPVKGEGGDKHKGHRIRTIDISAKDGIKALYCGEDKVVITYLFSREDKYDWTPAKAEAWVKEHSKKVTQAEIKDEIDYLILLIEESGLAEDTKIKAQELIKRISGGDIPVDIKTSPPIREMVAPIIKMMDEHHEAHENYYKACQAALKAMYDMPEGEMPKESFEDYLRKEIKKQIMEVK